MDVVAILAVRNEEAYIANCLRHLVRNGVNIAIIDNESTDATARIYSRQEFAAHLVHVETLPYEGFFSLKSQLQAKDALIGRLKADWVVHIDADEIMHSYRRDETLIQSIERLDRAGYNVIDFDEFVFLPVDHAYVCETITYQPMLHYYFFQPFEPRLMRAWRRGDGLSGLAHGGHLLSGGEIRLAPEKLALRHYILQSQAHASLKYTTRRFARAEIDLGWHKNRTIADPDAFVLPAPQALKRLEEPDARDLDRSSPWKKHYWERTLPGVQCSDRRRDLARSR